MYSSPASSYTRVRNLADIVRKNHATCHNAERSIPREHRQLRRPSKNYNFAKKLTGLVKKWGTQRGGMAHLITTGEVFSKKSPMFVNWKKNSDIQLKCCFLASKESDSLFACFLKTLFGERKLAEGGGRRMEVNKKPKYLVLCLCHCFKLQPVTGSFRAR